MSSLIRLVHFLNFSALSAADPIGQWPRALVVYIPTHFGAFRVVVISLVLDDDPGFLERVKDFAVQEFVAHLSVEALAVAVFPRATWREISGLCADGLDPVAVS